MRKILTVLSALLLVTSLRAGTATYNFDADPSSLLKITGNNPQPWRSAGGKSGGFLAITYPEGSQNTIVVFPDIDQGKIVTAFSFECDLRVGNPHLNVRPADGFSISFARSTDPVLQNQDASSFATSGAPETGTSTGIAISFDTWAGNALPDGADLEGIIVRVDNKTVLRQPMPTRSGACDDTTSLQTGPRDLPYWDGGGDPEDPASWAGLCWQPFSIDLDASGKLTVKYKSKTILDKFQTTYFPSAGSLVLAGRTGGADENTHFDNIKLTTVAVTPDTTAPSVPQSLASSGVGSRVAAFKWNPSTDDSGKVAYEIDRDGTPLTKNPITETSYVDGGLKPNTTYNYKVRAVDPFGNKSAYSSALTVKTDAETPVETKGLAKIEIWRSITGNAVQTLLDDPRYPGSPDLVLAGNRLDSRTVFPNDSNEGYGGRISAWLTPTESGQYEFFIRSDDASQLFLSPDDKEAGAAVIAEETGCCGAFEESGATETSAPVALQAGKKYYIQALWKEGTGGDFCQVAWRKVGDTTAASALQPIPGTFLSTSIDTKHGPPIILEGPKSQTVAAGASVTFTVSAIGTGPLTYQWQRGGVDVSGATSSTLTVNGAGQSNFGLYRVVVSNFEGTATSQGANLTVTGLPTALFIHATGGPNAADLAAVNHLQTLGLQVVTVGASPSQTSDADGKAVIVISSTVNSGDVLDKFRNTKVGILNWESALQDNFDETDRANDADGTTRGVLGGQSQVKIVKADHPLAAGLPAGVVAFASGRDISWGVVGPGATVIATVADDPTRAAIYAHDTGATLFDGTKSPGRRVHWPASDDTFLGLTANGLKLFDAAVTWAGNLTVAPPQAKFTKFAKNADGTITIEWTGGGTLQAGATVLGPWQDVPGATSPYTLKPAGAMLFGRIKN